MKRKKEEILIPMPQKVKTKKKKDYNKAINTKWCSLSKCKKYKKAAIYNSLQNIVEQLEDEFFDGVCFNFSGKNQLRGNGYQKKLFRKIVEKRQAKSLHRIIGRTDNLFLSYLSKNCYSKSMHEIQQYRHCL